MRWLGRMTGTGLVTCDGLEIGRADYEIDGYGRDPHGVTGSGEIRLPRAALESVFGRRGVQLRTDDGRLLDLRFTDKDLPPRGTPASELVAHVDVAGDLPARAEQWRH